MNDKVKAFIEDEETREALDATREHLKERLAKLAKAGEASKGKGGRKQIENPTPAQIKRRERYLRLKQKA